MPGLESVLGQIPAQPWGLLPLLSLQEGLDPSTGLLGVGRVSRLTGRAGLWLLCQAQEDPGSAWKEGIHRPRQAPRAHLLDLPQLPLGTPHATLDHLLLI